MATNDWKAELRRRIADIKEKKKSEQSIQDKAKTYLDKQRKEMEFRNALDSKQEAENTEAEVSSIREKTSVKAEPEKPASKAPTRKPVQEESLFQLDDEPEAKPREDSREKQIKEALKKFSKASAKVEQEAQRAEEAEKEEAGIRNAEPEAPESGAGTDALKKIRSTSKRMEESLDDAINRELPDDEIVKQKETGFNDVLKQIDPLSSADTFEDEEEEIGTSTIIDKSGKYVAGLRMVAAAADLMFCGLITVGFTWISAMILMTDIISVLTAAWLPATGLLLLVHALYYITFTSSSGQTPGKALFKLKTVTRSGGPMGILPALSRWILNIFSVAFAGIGILMAFMTQTSQTVPDSLLKQRVIRVNRD